MSPLSSNPTLSAKAGFGKATTIDPGTQNFLSFRILGHATVARLDGAAVDLCGCYLKFATGTGLNE